MALAKNPRTAMNNTGPRMIVKMRPATLRPVELVAETDVQVLLNGVLLQQVAVKFSLGATSAGTQV
jgi:hypothetical protein